MTAGAIDLSPLVSALLPLCAAVFLAAIGVIVAVRLKPAELLADNDRLRTRVDTLTQRYDDLDTAHRELKDRVDRELRVVGRGFDALYRLVERMRAHWGDGADMPILDATDQADVSAAQALRNKD